jgi:hypothetical protein
MGSSVEKDRLYSQLQNAKTSKKKLEVLGHTEWKTYQERQAEIGEKIKYYGSIGDEAANKMRDYLRESQTAYSYSDRGRAKELSLVGHDYERQSREANAEKDNWIQESKKLKDAFYNSSIQVELQSIKAEIDRMQLELNKLNDKI